MNQGIKMESWKEYLDCHKLRRITRKDLQKFYFTWIRWFNYARLPRQYNTPTWSISHQLTFLKEWKQTFCKHLYIFSVWRLQNIMKVKIKSKCSFLDNINVLGAVKFRFYDRLRFQNVKFAVIVRYHIYKTDEQWAELRCFAISQCTAFQSGSLALQPAAWT